MRTSRSVTIYDIARVAGVSASTVSRALSGHPNVAAATRESIRTAAAALRYRPNLMARTSRWAGRRRSACCSRTR